MVEVSTECCGKEMAHIENVQTMTDDIDRYVCKTCGLHKDIIKYCLDDEELCDEIDNYPELEGMEKPQ